MTAATRRAGPARPRRRSPAREPVRTRRQVRTVAQAPRRTATKCSATTPARPIPGCSTIAAAGDFVGMSVEETGKVPLSDLRSALAPVDAGGRPIDAAELPVAIAVREQRPVHETHQVRPAQGEERSVEILALPLIGPDERHE